jgi:chorismate synthase
MPINWQQVEASPVRCADAEAAKKMMAAIGEAKANGDTLGGIFEVIAAGVPIGLGSHVNWERRLDGRIAQAIMSINAVKGVEIGDGFALARLEGSQAHDIIEPNPSVIAVSQSTGPFSPCHSEHSEESRAAPGKLGEGESKQSLPWRRPTNYAGGIEGGMSNGEDIVARAAVKPIATLANPLPSIDLRSGEIAQAHYERSDICVVPAAGVIAEAMLAIILADACLEKFGGDNLRETLANYHNYLSAIGKD